MIGTLPVARQGARHRLRRPRLGRQRGRSVDRRDLRGDARRSRHRRLRAVPRNHAQGRSAARASRWRPPSAASRCWPTSSAARPRRASLRSSHTGALAGEDDIAGMFLAECGIARVDTLEGLIEGFPLLARVPAAAARRAARRPSPWSPPPPAAPPWWSIRWRRAASRSSRRRRRRWRASRPPPASTSTPARLIDLTLAGAQYEVMKGALDVLTTAPEFDLVVVGGRLLGAVLSRSRGQADHRQRRRAASRSRRSSCPKRRTRWRALAAAGVPNFHTPEACADAVAAALRRRAPRPIEARAEDSPAAGRLLDELEAYALLDRLGVPRAPSIALDAEHRAGARPALSLSGRRQGAVGRDRAQVRCRRRRAQRARR